MLKSLSDLQLSITRQVLDNNKQLITARIMRQLLLDVVESALESEEFIRVSSVSEFLELLDVLYTQVKLRLEREIPFAAAFTTKDFKVHIVDNTGIEENLVTPDGNQVTLNLEGLSLKKGGLYLSNNRATGEWEVRLEMVQEVYTNEQGVPLPIGGISAGETFDNVTLTEMLNRLIYPYVNPEITLTTNLPNTIEVGEAALPEGTDVELSYTSTFLNNLSYCVFKEADTEVSSEILPETVFSYSLGSYVGEPNIYLVPTDRTWSAMVTNTKEETYLGDSHTVRWVHRVFWGWATTAVTSADELALLGSALLRPNTYSKPETLEEAYLHIFLPTSYSPYTSFKTGGFDAVMAPVVEVTVTRLGASVDYRVYRQQFSTQGAFTLTVA